MLGSGSSDGWPNPWCDCTSCEAARAQGVSRANTSALVDGVLLLDAGHDAPRGAQRQGISLHDVQTALVTHKHHDHHDPQVWRWRSVADDSLPLTVLAPENVLQTARAQLADGVGIAAVPGDQHVLGGYEVTVLPATHVEGAVLYDVTGPDGGRLLWATDTGVLPDLAVELAAGRAYDLVLLELAGLDMPSHLTTAGWESQVDRLRAVGAVTERTRVVAVHLGHRNPPPDELDAWLADRGARAARDGDVYDTARGRRVLVLGGQSSGKSAHAESLLSGAVTYVATAPSREDTDWARRVEAHVARRPTSWTTLETADVAGVLEKLHGPVLVDDLGLWLTAVLEGHWDAPHEPFAEALTRLVDAWARTRANVVLVSPEVGSGVVPATASGRVFADLLGKATTALAAVSDEVVQVVAGIPRRLR